MGDRVLEIVVHLMDHLRDNQGQISDMEMMFTDLKGLGYTDNEISSAYCWVMDRFNGPDDAYFSDFPQKHSSSRILTNYERHQLTPDAYGFLIKLTHLDLIDDEQFEMVLERGSMFTPKPVSLEQIKLITSSIIFHDLAEFDSGGWFDSPSDNPQALN